MFCPDTDKLILQGQKFDDDYQYISIRYKNCAECSTNLSAINRYPVQLLYVNHHPNLDERDTHKVIKSNVET